MDDGLMDKWSDIWLNRVKDKSKDLHPGTRVLVFCILNEDLLAYCEV